MTHTAFRIAKKAAAKSTCPVSQMAAVVISGGRVLSVAFNGGPGVGRGRGRDHAETRALRPHRDYRGASMLVFRANGTKTSRPCPVCWQALVKAGIESVTYVGACGLLMTERVYATT